MNKGWHTKNAMPKRATTAQRIAWHVQHQKHCGCRPIPARLRDQMEAAKVMAAKSSTRAPQSAHVGELPAGFDAFRAFLPKNAKRALVYLPPVRKNSGPEKLKAIVDETLSEGVHDDTAYVFTNAKRDSLLVFWLAKDGKQMVRQRAAGSSFAFPAYAGGLPWASIELKNLRS